MRINPGVFSPPGRRSNGTTLFEVIIALGLLAAAAGVFAQLHSLAARQQRLSDVRGATSQSLANWMERSWQVSYDDLTEERLAQLAPRDALKEQLPELEAVARVEVEQSSPPGKRVTLILRWLSADGVGRESKHLTAWRFDAPAGEESLP